jgi:non-specific serine/threonine protein kinase
MQIAQESHLSSALFPLANEFGMAVQNVTGSSALAILLEAVNRPLNPDSHIAIFWQRFGHAFLKTLCLYADESPLLDIPDHIVEPFVTAAAKIGHGYIGEDDLREIWHLWAAQLALDATTSEFTLREHISKVFPSWELVGRIYFHLAESKEGSVLPFAFLATYSTRISSQARLQHKPLGQMIKESLKEDLTLGGMLKPLAKLAVTDGFLAKLIKSNKIFAPCYLSSNDAFRFLSEINLCEDAGIVVKLPKSWHGKKPPQAKVTLEVEAPKQESFVGFGHLMQFSAKLTVDGKELTPEEIAKLLANEKGLVALGGRWVEANPEKINQLLQRWGAALNMRGQGLSFAQAMRLLAGVEQAEEDEPLEVSFDVQPTKLMERLGQTMLTEEQASGILKTELQANLRHYQQKGVEWLQRVTHSGLGGCLADDMGLGKTLQVISLLTLKKFGRPKDRPQHRSLLIVPASLLGNWEREIRKFSPGLDFAIVHPSYPEDAPLRKEGLRRQTDLVITSYHFAAKISWIKDTTWDLVILDEAQAIKTPTSKLTKWVKALPRHCSVALTGTPIENKLRDLWSIFDFCCPTLLGNLEEFQKFEQQLGKTQDLSSLKKLVAPYLLRRKKTDPQVITDLPPKVEIPTYCMLTKEQISLYADTVKELARELALAKGSAKARRVQIFKYLMQFKQICNHPSQMLGKDNYDYKLSGKFIRLTGLAKIVAAKSEKLLVFTQFKEITDILDHHLATAFARPGLVLHGSTPVLERNKMVEEFQRDPLIPYFVLSLKAGGTGLNLTAANHVVHFDRWWNPAVENQATDRAFRIGQTRKVMVHKFICQGTIEDKIDAMLSHKNALATDILENQELDLTSLGDDEILNLVSLDRLNSTTRKA